MREMLEVGSCHADPLFMKLVEEGALEDASAYASTMSAYVMNHNLAVDIDNGINDREEREYEREQAAHPEPVKAAARTFRRMMNARMAVPSSTISKEN